MYKKILFLLSLNLSYCDGIKDLTKIKINDHRGNNSKEYNNNYYKKPETEIIYVEKPKPKKVIYIQNPEPPTTVYVSPQPRNTITYATPVNKNNDINNIYIFVVLLLLGLLLIIIKVFFTKFESGGNADNKGEGQNQQNNYKSYNNNDMKDCYDSENSRFNIDFSKDLNAIKKQLEYVVDKNHRSLPVLISFNDQNVYKFTNLIPLLQRIYDKYKSLVFYIEYCDKNKISNVLSYIRKLNTNYDKIPIYFNEDMSSDLRGQIQNTFSKANMFQYPDES
jgi:hypothetical protein